MGNRCTEAGVHEEYGLAHLDSKVMMLLVFRIFEMENAKAGCSTAALCSWRCRERFAVLSCTICSWAAGEAGKWLQITTPAGYFSETASGIVLNPKTR